MGSCTCCPLLPVAPFCIHLLLAGPLLWLPLFPSSKPQFAPIFIHSLTCRPSSSLRPPHQTNQPIGMAIQSCFPCFHHSCGASSRRLSVHLTLCCRLPMHPPTAALSSSPTAPLASLPLPHITLPSHDACSYLPCHAQSSSQLHLIFAARAARESPPPHLRPEQYQQPCSPVSGDFVAAAPRPLLTCLFPLMPSHFR